MKTISTLAFALVCLLTAGGHALAQNMGTDHSAHHVAAPANAVKTTEAEVRKVDQAAGKITLKHGEIKNIGMPPMSMVFQAKNPAMLAKIKVGDKVKFTADDNNGVLTVLTLEKIK
jgi:Cu/Ag efflux protein CusF